MESTTARYLESLPEPLDLDTVDLSFISLRLVVPRLRCWLRPGGDIVALIKPRLKAGPEWVPRDGMVRDPGGNGDPEFLVHWR